MNLLIFSHAFLPVYGGLEKFLHELSKELIARGHVIELMTWQLDPSHPREEVLDGIRVRRFKGLGEVLSQLRSWKNCHDFDLAMMAEPSGKHALISWAIRHNLRVPLLLNLLGTASETAPNWAKWLNSYYATRIVACSEYCARMFAFGKNKTNVIYHGVPEATIQSSFNPMVGPMRALCTSRVVRRKGIETLVQAAALSPEVEYRVIGNLEIDPTYTRELQALCSELGVKNLEFLGKVSQNQLQREYHQANLFVLPTLHEMFGIVFIEALAAGLPVVSTDVAAVPEVVTSDTGFLVQPGDPAALAERVLRFRNPELHARLASGALVRASHFRFETTVTRYLGEFNRLLACGG